MLSNNSQYQSVKQKNMWLYRLRQFSAFTQSVVSGPLVLI